MNNLVLVRNTSAGALTNAVATPEADEDRVSFLSIWSMFSRRIYTFLTVLATVLLLGLVITLRQTPTYQAEASVVLKTAPEEIAPVSTTGRPATASAPVDSYVDTQVAVVESDGMARKVADALHIASRPKMSVVMPHQSFFQRVLGLRPSGQPTRLTPAETEEAAIDYVQSGLSVRRTGTTYELRIEVASTNARDAALIANEYARQYAQADVVDQQVAGHQASSLVAQRLEQLRGRALGDTEAVQRYRIAHNLLSTTGASLTEQEISSYNQAVATARAQAAEDEARLGTARRQLNSGSAGDDVGEALGSGVVSALRGQQSAAAAKVADLSANYGPKYPELVRARSELASINTQIKAEIDRVISNLAAKSSVSRQRLGSLEGSLSGARAGLTQNNGAMVGLKDLEQRADTSQALYESYLNRYKELSAREGTEQASVAVLTTARTPVRPTTPRRFLNMLFSLAIGTVLGLAAAFAREYAFSGLTTGDDVVHRLNMRYLGLIPTRSSITESRDTPAALIVNEPQSAFAESFRSLRAAIKFAAGADTKVVAITSALPAEGKTVTSICLARSMALSGDRTVLVDCDLRKKGVSQFIRGIEDRPGLIEVLRGANTLDETLILDQPTGLRVLPIAYAVDNTDLMTGEEMDRLLETLRDRFDWVILDTAPVLPVAYSRVLLGKTDANVFAVRWRHTPDHAVRAALRQLPLGAASISGVMLTRVNLKKLVRFGFGDDTFYYNQYKNYYG